MHLTRHLKMQKALNFHFSKSELEISKTYYLHQLLLTKIQTAYATQNTHLLAELLSLFKGSARCCKMFEVGLVEATAWTLLDLIKNSINSSKKVV